MSQFFPGYSFFIGYRLGALSRPIGYGNSGYGYNYIHQHQGYNMEKPFICYKAHTVQYIKQLDEAQEISVEEDEVTCSSNDEFCLGYLQIVEGNFTESGSEEVIQGYEVSSNW